MDAAAIDTIQLNFNAGSMLALNVTIALMMMGMALDIKAADFRRVVSAPRAPAIGLCAQFLLLPAFTFLLTLVMRPHPSLALGMMLVASCPGGNLSNVMTYLAGGNTALSVSMTAVSTAVAVVMTPLNLSFWGNLNPYTAPIMQAVHLDSLLVFRNILLILGLPLAAGMLLARQAPALAERIRRPFKVISVLIFVAFVTGALLANWQNFLQSVGLVMLAVALHNALGLSLGYGAAKLSRLPDRDVRAVAIEVALQNSALGLVLVFDFFGGLGGMAVITAWWGVWHIISGLTISLIWSRRPLEQS